MRSGYTRGRIQKTAENIRINLIEAEDAVVMIFIQREPAI